MDYLIWKLLHVFSVIIFLGNITTGLFWASRANKTRDFKQISKTFQSIIKSDRVFTIPGIIGITITGFLAAINAGIPLLRTGWIFWPIVLFIVSGIFFSIYVAPLQRKILSYTNTNEMSDNNWTEYTKLFKLWELWGFLALITPYAAMVIMILKPNISGL